MGDSKQRFDAIVIGAGFGGLYASYKLRELGFSRRVLEMGDGIGGTWYWNRYPGARVDVEAVEYSYSFSPEVEAEWTWTEVMPTQGEIERYLNFVADRLDLRRDIEFATKVAAAVFDETAGEWLVTTEAGAAYRCRYLIAATGCLSAPLEPDIAGIDSFAGVTLFTNRFPKAGFDFSGLRVGVIGTGSSGVQAIPVIAEKAKELYVFQRSAAFSRPANNRPYAPGEFAELRKEYPEIRQRQLESFAGTLRFGAVAIPLDPPTDKILEASPEARLRKIDEMGWGAPWSWADVMVDLDANQVGVDLFAELVRRTVKDPDVAAALVPHYPLGCKRLIIDTNYFETFNLDHVTLVDLRRGGIERITPAGIQTEQGHFDLDVIVYATGFDAMTGALNRIDIRGRGGERLRDVWAAGPHTYLGLQTAGFPNLFMITGPQSPSVHTNMVVAIEHHVGWIGELLDHMRAHDRRVVEPTADAQEQWGRRVAGLVEGTIRASAGCNSWYLGANVPGKPREYMSYVGGQPLYRQDCDEVVAAGYRGFVFS